MNRSSGSVSLRFEHAIAIVELDRPEKLNALTPEMLDQLDDIAKSLDQRTDIIAAIITAAGDRAFCVGADIHVWAELKPLDMWRHWTRKGHQVFDLWARLRFPVIAAINGHAFGGGLELLATADIRVCDPNATFALPETGIATCPGWSGTQRLVRLIGASSVKYLAMTGRKMNAEQALKQGLIQEISHSGEVLACALQIAEEIGRKAPISIQLTKQLIDAGEGHHLAAVLEGMAGALAATTEDAKEGLASFSERRSADYKGR